MFPASLLIVEHRTQYEAYLSYESYFSTNKGRLSATSTVSDELALVLLSCAPAYEVDEEDSQRPV